MTSEQILALVRAYGDVRAARAAVDAALQNGTRDAAHGRAAEALSDAAEALSDAVQSTLASYR